MPKYLISTKDSEVWTCIDEFDSLSEAIDALDSGKYDDELFGILHPDDKISSEYRDTATVIGVKTPVIPEDCIDGWMIIERMQEYAGELAGEVADDFLRRKDVKEKEQELKDAVRKVVSEWLAKNGLTPTFYGVEDIITLKEARRRDDCEAQDAGGHGR